MKVRVDHGRLVEMSKVMRSDRICGENVGMLRLSSTSLGHVADAARTIAASGGERAWLAAAINHVAVDHPCCVDVAGWPWVEIDFPEDLARARSEVFPAVTGEMATESYGLFECTRWRGAPDEDSVHRVRAGSLPLLQAALRPARGHPGDRGAALGGTRSKSLNALGGYLYDHETMYRQFELPEGSVIPVASLARANYDVIFGEHPKDRTPTGGPTDSDLPRSVISQSRDPARNRGRGPLLPPGPVHEAWLRGRGDPGSDDIRGVEIGFPKTDRLLDGSIQRDDVLARQRISGDRPVCCMPPPASAGTRSRRWARS